ncbi:MAG: chromosome segregation protein SMC [Candidatus Thermoplasmatota archaeon]|nr:chromosome segregation protein SMC [Candidatus Thermoplasmatota archaeon]
MYLKEVVLENFKSFGKKTRVPFLQGFTAVTGPNASGKSNISDAVLFVLGPKSSKVVRAGKLTDLIFNGGNGRKNPGYCKVSLVFDNSDRTIPLDSNEVTLTRLVKYANNPENYYSYFYVNGKTSSLTEFENLLAHAHISADGYNFVQQGHINAITSMSNLERRRILDDIAGITKFDSDIEKADRKGEEVEQNMERIGIILKEIKGHLKSLERDRGGALKYKGLKDELMTRKYQLCIRRKNSIENEIENLKKQINEYTKEKADFEKKLGEIKNEYENVERVFGEIEDKIADKGGEEAKKIKEEIDEMRTTLVRATEGINYSKDEVKRLKDERARIVIELNNVEKELKKNEKEKSRVEKELKNNEKTLNETQEKYSEVQTLISKSDSESLSIQKNLAQMKKEYETRQDVLKTLKIEKDVLSEKVQRLNSDIASTEESIKTYEAEIKDIEFEEKNLKKSLSAKTDMMKELQNELSLKKSEEEKLIKQIKEITPKITRLMNLKSQLNAELEANEFVSKGYTRAVKEILNARESGELKGIHGAVAELGTSPEEYEDALSIAAGSRMQSIIVDNDANAAKAIAYLRQKKLGRVTFLPLNKMMKGMAAGKSLMVVKNPESLGFAIDLVKFDEKYRNAFWYVFGSTIIMKDLDAARKCMGGVRLVTLDGELLEAGGAMIGGSIEKHMKFSRGESEIDRISKELRDAVQKQELLSSQILAVREKINSIYGDLKKYDVEDSSVTMKMTDLGVKHKDYKSKLNALKIDRDQKLNEKNENEKILLEKNREIEENEKETARLDREKEEKGRLLMKSTTAELASMSKTLKNEMDRVADEVRTMSSQGKTLSTQIQIIEQRKQELIENETRIVKTISSHEEKIKTFINTKNECENKVDALMKVGQAMDGEMEGLNKKREKAYEDIVNLRNTLENYSGKIDTYGNMASDVSRKIPGFEEKLAEIIGEMQNYPDTSKKNMDEELSSVEYLKDTIRKCESVMASLEPVNMRALDDYDVQEKRKNELEEEIKHLIEQKRNLVKLVDALKNRKRENLLTVFDAVNENFKEIYPELSNNKEEAELVLENPDDLFEGGMAIHVKPKDSRVMRLEALSGGEKSLTALALIFAIQHYKPSPFYVLDEVDMFLDAVNAEKIAQMVKNNSKYAQFIMMTLRKITLKEADHVYGVVKQSNGISNIIGNVNISQVGEKGEINVGGSR